MKAAKVFEESPVVAGRSSEASDPGEGSFDHLAHGQQDKPALGGAQFEHCKLDPVQL